MIVITHRWVDETSNELVLKVHQYRGEVRIPLSILACEPSPVVLRLLAEGFMNAQRKNQMIPDRRHEARNF